MSLVTVLVIVVTDLSTLASSDTALHWLSSQNPTLVRTLKVAHPLHASVVLACAFGVQLHANPAAGGELRLAGVAHGADGV